jgi:hypothetical protein
MRLNRFATPVAACALVSAGLLTGCGVGYANFPDTPAQVQVGAIQGSNFGGHAPLVGSHVYLLQASSGGYGAQAKSILNTGSGNTGLTQNTSDPGIPTSWYYTTSGSDGGFHLTGDYACTVGEPVYLYAYAGTPSYPAASGTATNNTFNVGGANGTAGTATESFAFGGGLSGVSITNPGYLLTSGTYVINADTGSGGGSGAQIQVTVDNSLVLFGVVSNVSVLSAGTGYTSAPTFTAHLGGLFPTEPSFSATVSPIVDNVQFTLAATNTAGVSNPPENFYVGEPVTFSGLGTGTGSAGAVVGSSGTVIASGLTTTQFEVQITGGTLNSASTSLTVAAGATVTGTPYNNPAIVNMAMLGVCPSSGNFATGGTLSNGQTFAPLRYVYMNEVSTAALAFAMEGFSNTAATAGYGTYLGSSSSNLVGIENAAYNAGLLYDIQGSNTSTTYAGEGHIARAVTPTGNGIVPQSTLDTLGNILASCVDSNNTTSTNNGAGESPQCKSLFQTATSNGIPYGNSGAGNVPVDTAQAAFNIAHNPAGNVGYSATFVSNLYTLPTGNVPFTPNLTAQPNDFTIAIQYPMTQTGSMTTGNPQLQTAESIAIDAYGDVWLDSQAPQEVVEMSPQGAIAYTSPALGHLPGYVSVDASGNIWTGCAFTTCGLAKYTVTTTTLPTYSQTVSGPTLSGVSTYDPYMTVANSAGNQYFGAAPSSTGIFQTYALNSSGGLISPFPTSASLNTGDNIAHGAVENVSAGGDVWWTTENAFAIVRLNPSTGAVASGFPIFTTGTGGATYTANISAPEMPAIDSAGNLWAANQSGTYAGTVVRVTGAGAVSNTTGGTLNTPFGVTIDGAGNVFVANRGTGTGGNSIAEFSGATMTNISPSAANYTLGGQLLQPLNIAIDQSGNLWATSYDQNMVVQWIGAGAPSSNPLSIASGKNKLGTKP